MTKFNFTYYIHSKGGAYYDQIIKKNEIPEDVARCKELSFRICDDYPLLICPAKETVYYNSYGKLVNEKFLEDFRKPIMNAFENENEFLLISDGHLIGNDKYIYGEFWHDQPITYDGKISSFLHMMVCLRTGDGMKYYFYPLRTGGASEFLETYFGSFFSKSLTLELLGMNIWADLVRLNYSCQYVDAKGILDKLLDKPVRDMGQYQVRDIYQLVSKK